MPETARDRVPCYAENPHEPHDWTFADDYPLMRCPGTISDDALCPLCKERERENDTLCPACRSEDGYGDEDFDR